MAIKVFGILLFMLSSVMTMRAQAVYELVLSNATRTINSPSSGYTQTQIAEFKRSALLYLKRKTMECDSVTSVSLLDTQAYYLSEYVSLFFKEILKGKRLSEGRKRRKIMIFMEASASNPLFFDADDDEVLYYVRKSDTITPFSLDTDWERAYLTVSDEL